MKKKPDNVADKPNILPYGTNVGAPAIKPNDVGVWRGEKIIKTNQYFEAKFNEIKEDYQKLIENYEWNKLVYASDFKFEPEKGKVYFLYQKEDGIDFMSMIGPEEWGRKKNWANFVAEIKLLADHTWEIIREVS